MEHLETDQLQFYIYYLKFLFKQENSSQSDLVTAWRDSQVSFDFKLCVVSSLGALLCSCHIINRSTEWWYKYINTYVPLLLFCVIVMIKSPEWWFSEALPLSDLWQQFIVRQRRYNTTEKTSTIRWPPQSKHLLSVTVKTPLWQEETSVTQGGAAIYCNRLGVRGGSRWCLIHFVQKSHMRY